MENPGTSTLEEFEHGKSELAWPSEDTPLPPRQRLVMVMDQLETRVEKLRSDALRIEQEKDRLLATMDTVKESELMLELNECDAEYMKNSLDRLIARCFTIDTVVHTYRDLQQEDNLHKVNECIDSLVISVKTDPKAAHIRCMSYMAAFSFQKNSDSLDTVSDGFKDAILGCTLDDQKKIKKRLQGLLDYFIKMNIREN